MIRCLDLAEYFWLAEQVTGIEAAVLAKASRPELADSALHAPSAGFGDEEFYPDIMDKAAVLTCRLAWNHPLPDGNKRAAWASLVLFVELNDGAWEPDPPKVDEAEQAMLAVAAGQVDEPWLGDRPAARSGSRGSWNCDHWCCQNGDSRVEVAQALSDPYHPAARFISDAGDGGFRPGDRRV